MNKRASVFVIKFEAFVCQYFGVSAFSLLPAPPYYANVLIIVGGYCEQLSKYDLAHIVP